MFEKLREKRGWLCPEVTDKASQGRLCLLGNNNKFYLLRLSICTSDHVSS